MNSTKAFDTYAGLAPSTDQERARLAAKNLAEYLRGLDTRGLAHLLGACQAEVSERGLLSAVEPLCAAQARIEAYRDDAAAMVARCVERQQGDTGPVEWQRAAELPDTPPEFRHPSDTGREDVVPLPAVDPVPTWGAGA